VQKTTFKQYFSLVIGDVFGGCAAGCILVLPIDRMVWFLVLGQKNKKRIQIFKIIVGGKGLNRGCANSNNTLFLFEIGQLKSGSSIQLVAVGPRHRTKLVHTVHTLGRQKKFRTLLKRWRRA